MEFGDKPCYNLVRHEYIRNTSSYTAFASCGVSETEKGIANLFQYGKIDYISAIGICYDGNPEGANFFADVP